MERQTGLGNRFGSCLLQAGLKRKYNHVGTHQEGSGGLWQQMATKVWIPKAFKPRSNRCCSVTLLH
jgi:hypothetical protein